MKKFFKALIIILIVFIIIPVALVFILFFDTGKMKVTYDDNFKNEEWSKALVVDSLDYTESDQAAKFIVTESDINNLIHAAMKDNKELSNYLTQLAVDIQNDQYVINASGKLYFFETRAKLHAKLERKIVSNGATEAEAFVFSVDKLSLGRLSHLKDVVMFFLKQFLKNSTLDALTASLKLHTDLQHACIFIYASDLRDILNNAITGDNGSSGFFFSFINDFLDMNLLEFDFYGNDAFTVSVNLKRLTGNDYGEGQYVAYNMKYDDTTTKLNINGEEKKLSLKVIKEALKYLMDNNIIPETEMTRLSDYLFHGYDGSYLPDADLSSIGIPIKTTYQGFNLVNAESLENTLKEGVSSFADYSSSINTFDIVKLNESVINDFLKTQNVFGMKYFLTRDVKDNGVKINYIALDNAYINLLNEGCIITVGLNLNGLETIITLEMELDKNNDDSSKLVYNASRTYFGKKSENLSLSNDTEELIFETLADAVVSDTFKFSKEGTLTIAFNNIINQSISMINTGDATYDNLYKNFLTNDSTHSIRVNGEKVEDNAEVIISATRK